MNRRELIGSVTPRRRWPAAVLSMGVLFGLMESARAVTLTLRNVKDDQAAAVLGFGSLDPSISHQTALQYLDIAHSASLDRKLYLYTTNQEKLGKAEKGLVASGAGAALPFFYYNYPNKSASRPFGLGNESQWTEILEKSQPDFETLKPADALLTPTEGRSLVFLGVKVASTTAPDNFQSHLVLEESSTGADITDPSLAHTPFNDVILIDIPMGVSGTIVEESTPVAATLYYRLQGEPVFQSVPATVTPDPSNPIGYDFEAPLPDTLMGPAVLEYYFTAVDKFGNDSRLPSEDGDVFRSNLVPENGTVTRTVTSAGGRVDIAIGDPRWPGFSLDIPSASGLQKVTVALKPTTAVPRLNGVPPVQVFEVGPHGAHFNQSATLSIPYLDEDQDALVDGTGVNETTLRIYWHDGIEWRLVGGQVDADGNRATARVSHFSVFALFPAGAPPTVETVRPKEKVFTPNGDGVWDSAVFNIDPMDGDIEIEIYNTRGDRVRRIVNLAEWNGRDDDGNMVENGTYIYRLTGQGLTVTGMLAVAR